MMMMSGNYRSSAALDCMSYQRGRGKGQLLRPKSVVCAKILLCSRIWAVCPWHLYYQQYFSYLHPFSSCTCTVFERYHSYAATAGFRL